MNISKFIVKLILAFFVFSAVPVQGPIFAIGEQTGYQVIKRRLEVLIREGFPAIAMFGLAFYAYNISGEKPGVMGKTASSVGAAATLCGLRAFKKISEEW